MSTMEVNRVLYEDINYKFQKFLYDPFLERCGILPQASRFHFEVGAAILTAAGVPKEEAEEILTALLLLQEGLSIHDDIEEQVGRQRQLYVLTGDFGSSQYFYVLAHLGDGSLLYQLCDAVVRINEAKMTLLELPSEASADVRFSLHNAVEGELLYALVKRYLPGNNLWQAQIESLVRAYVLKEVPSVTNLIVLPERQRYTWFEETLERLLKLQKNSGLAPISNLFVDYFRSLQRNFEGYVALSKGNS